MKSDDVESWLFQTLHGSKSLYLHGFSTAVGKRVAKDTCKNCFELAERSVGSVKSCENPVRWQKADIGLLDTTVLVIDMASV